MKKYFHELAEKEFKAVVDEKITWEECAESYPQPEWCRYSDAVQGIMGCWSLMSHMVTGEDFCKTCEMYKEVNNAQK